MALAFFYRLTVKSAAGHIALRPAGHQASRVEMMAAAGAVAYDARLHVFTLSTGLLHRARTDRLYTTLLGPSITGRVRPMRGAADRALARPPRPTECYPTDRHPALRSPPVGGDDAVHGRHCQRDAPRTAVVTTAKCVLYYTTRQQPAGDSTPIRFHLMLLPFPYSWPR